MTPTTLRDRRGYCVGISAMVPIEVDLALHAEVEHRRKMGIQADRDGGHAVTRSDVLRAILVGWSRRRGQVGWWSWQGDTVAHGRRRGGGRTTGRPLCGAKLDRRACLDLGALPACPACLAVLRGF